MNSLRNMSISRRLWLILIVAVLMLLALGMLMLKQIHDDLYQAKRQQRVREEYNAAKEAGTAETFWTVVWAEPARVALTVLGIFFMLALVALPIILLRR